MSAPRRRWIVLCTALALVIAGTIGTIRFLAPPAIPPAYTDPRPEPVGEGYLSHTESVFVDVPPAELHAWMQRPQANLSETIQGDGGLEVVGTENILGDWDPSTDRTGDRRRVEFADGHYLAEEVLADDPGEFRYMVWGFTGPQRLAVRYGVASFTFTPQGEGTRLEWTYSFQPTTALMRPVLSGFISDSMVPMMRATVVAMRDGAEADHEPQEP